MQATKVEDHEDLYRSIRARGGEYAITPDGHLRFSTSAFNDRYKKPSVDRSAIRAVPQESRKNPTDGITALKTAAVRAIRTIHVNPNKKGDVSTYQVDAIHRPLPDDADETENPAHTQIECCPSIASDSHFKKLKEALALLANERGFLIPPALE